MLKLVADANVRGSVVRGLRRRMPDIDLVRVEDVLPHGTPDPQILAWAAEENRVLISNDRKTMIRFTYGRVAAGEAMPGLIVTSKRQPIGAVVEDILLIATCVPEEEIRDQVLFLPYRR